jgi:hypothetical protein
MNRGKPGRSRISSFIASASISHIVIATASLDTDGTCTAVIVSGPSPFCDLVEEHIP